MTLFQNGSVLNLEKLRGFCSTFLSEKNKKDVAFTFVRENKDFMVFNKEEMANQMKQWKRLAQGGKIQLYECNNLEYDMDSRYVYTMTITTRPLTMRLDPMSLAWGTMVNGVTFGFTKKVNRDAAFTFVKQYCVEEEPEEEDLFEDPPKGKESKHYCDVSDHENEVRFQGF